MWRILEEATLKSSTIVVVLLAGTSAAMAQNGPATGGERPLAGGANGAGPYYGHVYRMDTGTGPMGIYMSAADVRGSGPRPPALVC